jgi:transposase
MAQCLDDYVGKDNPVRVIDVFVDTLDLNTLGFQKATLAKTGRPPFHPGDLIRLYIYGYTNGIRSTRKLEAEARRNQEVMWLLRKLTPDYKTIADFRRDNREPLTRVFAQFNALCREWGLIGGEVVATDGTKIRASNSKRNNYSAKKVARHLEYLATKDVAYLEELDECDSFECAPPFARASIVQALKDNEARKEGYRALAEEISRNGEVSTVDPDARLMGVHNNGVDVCYNVQAVVDAKHSLVVVADVINSATDQGQLSVMGIKAQEALEVDELTNMVDKGYYMAEDLKRCEDAGIIVLATRPTPANSTGVKEYLNDQFVYDPQTDTYTCPQGKVLTRLNDKTEAERVEYRNWEACKECPVRELCTTSKRGRRISRSKYQPIMDTVDRRTKANRALYATRQAIIEHVFGTLKRSMGFTYFLTRGLESVRAEASLAFLGYNLKRAISLLGVERILKELASKAVAISFVLWPNRVRIVIFREILG